MTKKKAIVSWSTGKDGAYAYHKATQSGEFEIVGLLTTITETFERVSMHGTREALLDEQARKLGQPILKVQIPWPCTNEIYEEQMGKAVEQIKAQGVTHIIFGDLYLEDIRDYRLGRISRGHPSCNEVKFCDPLFRRVTIWLSFQNPGTPMARINRREGNACGATHPDARFCDETTINCSVNCQKKVGWPQLNAPPSI